MMDMMQLLTAAFVLLFISEAIRSERRRINGNSEVIMQIVKPIFPGLVNGTRAYSPITLCREWSTLARLVVVVFASCFGATLNGYFVSSFFVDHDLRRIGNVYHACAGMADMMITAGIMPMAAVVLLSGVWDINPVCHVLQTLAACSTYCYSMYYSFVSGETYFRVCHSRKRFENNISLGIAVAAVFVFLVGTTLSAMGTYLDLDYDYCERRHFGNFYFRLGTALLVHGTSFVWTMYALIASSIRIRQQNRLQPRYRKSIQYHRDVAMIKLNIMAYLLYVGAWLPYLIVVNLFPDASDSWYYQSAWAGICRPLFSSVFYGSLNSAFGRAYSNIFNYCCCKSSMHNYPPRQRKIMEYFARPSRVDVRTHIMQQVINPNSPQRATCSTRETIDL